jgi:ABC-type glucose/galactose transport system permease subunit
MTRLATIFIVGVIVALISELGVATGHFHPWITVPLTMAVCAAVYGILGLEKGETK